MTLRGPDAGRATAADVTRETTRALVITQQSSLPFTGGDAALAFDLAAAWQRDKSPTRARRLRELGVRIARLSAGAPAGITICDAADLFHSGRHCRLVSEAEREHAQLLAWRIMRALDYSAPRAARYQVTAAGYDALTDGTADVAEDADALELVHASPAAAGSACTGRIPDVHAPREG